MPRATANSALPATTPVDTLMKLPDDGNKATDYDTAVYYVGLDGKRHPYVNGTIYQSWYTDFSKVKVIDSTTMSKVTLGRPILPRPGSYWVKIQSDPKTYYVSPDGYTLRWIQDEATAVLLGGSDWNKKIIDIEPTFFTKFNSDGAVITTTTLASSWPEGSLVKSTTDTTTWYITKTGRRAVTSAEVLKANYFQDKFVETTDAAGWKAMPVEANVTSMEDSLFSLQNL